MWNAFSRWPRGWSQPAPMYNKYTDMYEKMPIQWVKGRPARKKDKEALMHYYGNSKAFNELFVDKYTLVGKRDPNYTTRRIQRMKELHYNWLDRWRF